MEKSIIYPEWLEVQKYLIEITDKLSNDLNMFPKDDIGMVTEETRKSEAYIFTKKLFTNQFKQLQTINSFVQKNFKKEIDKYRLEKRRKVYKIILTKF